MANPTVEKLKDIGLRFGDKAVVALASLIFVVCLGLAVSKKTIDTTPDAIKKTAEQAEANINRRQERDEVIKILTDGGIKDTDFAKQVEESSKTVLLADNYRPDREMVTPEPGAGLIRDTPKLVAVTNLFAYPGRGGALVYALDDEGNRILETEKKELPKETIGRRRRRSRMGSGGMGGMGYGGMMGGRGARKGSRKSQADMEREAKQEVAQREREMKSKLAGPDEPAQKDETEKAETEKNQGPPPKEIVKGLRWVAITGTLDHAKMLANYREALKNPSIAHPHYARLDLQRQVLQRDGTWSDWEEVDAKQNYKVLDNLPEWDEELTPDNVRPDNLNDPLPFLKSGLWEKVHIASLVPKERKEIPKAAPMGGMGMEGMGGKEGGGMRGGYGAMMGMMGGGGGGRPGMMGGSGRPGMMGGSGGMMGGMMGRGGKGGDNEGGMMGGSGYGGMMGGGGGGDVGNYWKSEDKKVMIRALDFTPESDNEYRYRLRIVVFNPNKNRDDVSPGVDTKATELFGPWSEATSEVRMPPDAAAYAMGTLPANPKSDIKVRFQVIRFNPENGVTVPATFDAGPGEVIGEVRTRDVPVSDGSGKKPKPVDFNTHEIVLDAAGGFQALPAGLTGGALDRPAVSLLLRPDGLVMVRSQPEDVVNEVRKDIERNYIREIKDSDKERQSSMGSGYGGMMGGGGMGGYGGMMGGGGMGGYGGMMGSGRR